MGSITSRDDLKQYALRKLGAPVIEINVSDDQLEDRIDDAFQYFGDYHYDAISRTYLQHQVTTEDQTNGYFEIDPAIISVTKVFPLSTQTMNMFDIRYQVRLNDFYNFNNVSMIHYTMTRNHLALLDFLFNTLPTIEFNRHMQQIALTGLDWQNDVQPGQYIVIECWALVDPDTFTDIYNDRFLKMLVTCLFKKQWASNLKKYGGIQLPGGIILNGKELWDEAVEEWEDLMHQLKTEFQEPPVFEIGAYIPLPFITFYILILSHFKNINLINNNVWENIISIFTKILGTINHFI